MKIRCQILSLFLFLLYVVPLQAGQYAFKYFDEGTTPNVGTVLGMMQDGDNMIWIWGDNGVLSYDGSRFNHYAEAEGLSDKYCYEVYEMASGEIVFCTFKGLCVFDKNTGKIRPWISFTGTPTRDIVFTQNGIILALDYGIFWKRNGISLFIPNYDRLTHQHKDWMASKLVYDEENKFLWVVSDREGLFRYDMSIVDKLMEFNEPPDSSILYNGDPYILFTNTTEGELLPAETFVVSDSLDRDRLWQQAVHQVKADNSLIFWHVKDILRTDNGDIYGWGFGRVYRFNGNIFVDVSKEFGLESKKVNHVTQDNEGNLVFSCLDGVLIHRNGQKYFFNRQSGLISNNISRTLVDRNDYLWLVDENGNVNKLTNTVVKIFSSDKYPPLTGIHRAIKLNDGSILFGGENGLSFYKDGKVTFISSLGSLGDEFREFAIDKNNNVLIATLSRLYYLDVSNNELRALTPVMTHHYGAFRFSMAPDGKLWTGLYGNLYSWDGETLVNHPIYEDVLYYPTDILAASDTTIFLGQWSGLQRFRPGTKERWALLTDVYIYSGHNNQELKSVVFPNSDWEVIDTFGMEYFLDTPAVMCGDLGPDGKYWFGTFAAGLISIDIDVDPSQVFKRLNRIDSRNGLPDDHVLSVFKDESGDLYFVLDKGACKITKDGFEILHRQIPGKAMVNQLYQDEKGRTLYATSSGVFILDHDRQYMLDKGFGLKESHVKQLIPLEEGKTIAVQPNGFAVFSVDELLGSVSSNTGPVIREIWADDARLDLNKDIVLDNKRRSCRIEFSLPDFFNEDQNYYSWKMEGFDPDFTGYTHTAFANYTNLPKGRYNFHLKARNGYGEVTELKTPLVLIVPPRFYETAYFYVIIIAVVLLVFFVFYKRQVEKIKREREQRLKIESEKLKSVSKLASAVAHEFNNPLAIIKGSVEINKLDHRREDVELMKRDQVILKQVDRMSNLVVKLLNIKEIKTLEYTEGTRILDINRSSDSSEELYVKRSSNFQEHR